MKNNWYDLINSKEPLQYFVLRDLFSNLKTLFYNTEMTHSLQAKIYLCSFSAKILNFGPTGESGLNGPFYETAKVKKKNIFEINQSITFLILLFLFGKDTVD